MFIPKVNERLLLGSEVYFYTEHPAAKGMPYGQTGRKATVFQLRDAEGQKRALKVFQAKYRTEENLEKTSDFLRYCTMPGLATCERFVISKQQFPSLIQQNKDLNYSVLMPWVEGTTWQDIVLNKVSLDEDACYQIASNLNMVLGSMEANGMAHCDLSGPNIILRPRELKDDEEDLVSLIDLEEMYAPKLSRPKSVPAGSAGYAHSCIKTGVWSADADRFAGSVLLANMLTWSDPSVVNAAFGEQYFAPDEMQIDCPRYQTLVGSLERQWGKNTSELFSTAWNSRTLGDCPTFIDWADALSVEIPNVSLLEPIQEPKNQPVAPTPPANHTFIPPRNQSGPVSISSTGPVRGFRPLISPQGPIPSSKVTPSSERPVELKPAYDPKPVVGTVSAQATSFHHAKAKTKFKEIDRLSTWHEVFLPNNNMHETKLPEGSQTVGEKSTMKPPKQTSAGITILNAFLLVIALGLFLWFILWALGG